MVRLSMLFVGDETIEVITDKPIEIVIHKSLIHDGVSFDISKRRCIVNFFNIYT